MPPHATRTIFVANIPYDVSEEQLAGVFSDVGPVANVEIKFDTATGRSKGYAFVQFYDEATASSAVRNLSSVEVNGRNLRVEASTDDPGPRSRQEAGGGAGGGPGRGRRDSPPRFGGPPAGGGYPPMGMGGGAPPGAGPGPGFGGPEQPPRVDLGQLPMGQEVRPGQAADAISKTLAAVTPGQMQDVMAGMKTLVMTQPEQARQLLQSKPQLAYALFQAMLLMNIVDPSVLNRIQPMPASAPPPQAYNNAPYPQGGGYQSGPPPPQNAYGTGPGGNGYRPPGLPGGAGPGPGPGYGGGGGGPPPGGFGYNAPAPVGGMPPRPAQPPQPALSGLAALPPQAQAALAGLPEDQKNMLVQVLQLTPDQISALDPTQKASVLQLRQQFLG